jgi:hypothetical protein
MTKDNKMKNKITVYNDEKSMSLEKESGYDSIDLLRGENVVISLSQDELRELKIMIEELLQLTNKRDW